MAKFDFNKFKTERVAKTVGGATARFICESRGKMVVEIIPIVNQPFTAKYNLDGCRYSNTVEHFEDLVNA